MMAMTRVTMRLAMVTLTRMVEDVHIGDDERHNDVGYGDSYLVHVGDDERHNEVGDGDADKEGEADQQDLYDAVAATHTPHLTTEEQFYNCVQFDKKISELAYR